MPGAGALALEPGAVALGPGALALGPGAVAMGLGAVALGPGAVALGSWLAGALGFPNLHLNKANVSLNNKLRIAYYTSESPAQP